MTGDFYNNSEIIITKVMIRFREIQNFNFADILRIYISGSLVSGKMLPTGILYLLKILFLGNTNVWNFTVYGILISGKQEC